MKQNILATDFNAKSLFAYIFPTILMMVFMSTYTIIDGIFVAKLVGEDALSAINIVFPTILLIMALSLMFATGANAIISKLLGEGNEHEARSFLTTIYVLGGIFAIILTLLALFFPDEILNLLGTSPALYPYAKAYLLALSPFAIGYFYQIFVQTFLITAGKPMLGFILCVCGGLTNIVLDYLFISPNVLNLGITGAGLATGIGNLVPAVGGFIYFLAKKNPHLYFCKPNLSPKLILLSLYNGSSEFVTQISTAITTIIFNIILLDIAGEAGVASISVILYIQMMQTAIYFGISIGIAPIIGYKYGENNHSGLKSVIKLGLMFTFVASILVIALSVLCSDFLISIFIDTQSSTFKMAKQGLILFSTAYIFMGANTYLSSMFTSLSNGKISAIISLSRTLIFLIPSLLILPKISGIIGVWFAVPLAEFLAIFISLFCFYRYRKVYHY